jgi:hypothetical protein
MSKSKYQENLIKTVMDKSWGNTWKEAVQEWDIIDCAEDNSLSRSCICGKEQIKYLYRLHNRKTNQWLFPIGSSCIKKFQRKDLQEKTATTEAMFKLLHAVGNNQYLQLSSDLFSRKLLKELYDQGAFKATSYNHYNPNFVHKEYNSLTKMKEDSIVECKITKIGRVYITINNGYPNRQFFIKSGNDYEFGIQEKENAIDGGILCFTREDAEKHLLKKKMMLELRNINYSEKTNSLNQLLLMKLAYEVGKLDFTDDTMLKIPLPVNYKEMSEETLKSFLESDGEYE